MIGHSHRLPYTKGVAPTQTHRVQNTESSLRTPSEQAWDLVRQLISGGEIVGRMARLSKEKDLSPGSIKALQHLRRGGYLSMRDIARSLGCDPSYVTGLVDELAQHGLVERQSHPDDRRIKTVVLTSAGIEVADEVEQSFGTPPAAFDALSDREAEQLARILAKVTEPA
jgi:DNA-binding MarR family transcriptional regulator